MLNTSAYFASRSSDFLPHLMVSSVWTSNDANKSSSTYARMHCKRRVPSALSEPSTTTFRAMGMHI